MTFDEKRLRDALKGIGAAIDAAIGDKADAIRGLA